MVKNQCNAPTLVEVSQVTPNPRNPYKHSSEQIRLLAKIIAHQGFRHPIIVSKRSGMIVAGHARLKAAIANDYTHVPVDMQDFANDEDEMAFMLADNQIDEFRETDKDMLQSIAFDLGPGFDFDLAGLPNLFVAGVGQTNENIPKLSDRFLVPPFSIFDARQGYWQDRKRQWLDLGIQSEIGRGNNLLRMSDQMRVAQAGGDPYGKSKSFNTEGTIGGWDGGDAWQGTGTSIFDPVLCEISYRWFSPKGGLIVDPFAGGSVRGITAGVLGREYHGVELRAEQVAANYEQAKRLVPDAKINWTVGNSVESLGIPEASADMMLTCPPYWNLEQYSDDKADLSNMPWEEFCNAYAKVFKNSFLALKENSFAVIVVGEVRDDAGNYVGLVPETIKVMSDAGFRFYNEAILITAYGSLMLRAGRTFVSSRKLGKTHQNVLVFVKGESSKACEKCGEIEISDITTDGITND